MRFKNKCLALLVLFCLAFLNLAQADPAEPAEDLRALLGFYQTEGENIIIREREGRLELLYGVTVGDYAFNQSNCFQLVRNRYDDYTLAVANPRDYRGELSVKFERDKEGRGITCIIDKKRYSRIFFAGENKNHFKVSLAEPLTVLREKAQKEVMPSQLTSLLAAELVNIRQVDSQIKIQLVYAGEDNFLDTAVYESPQAYLQKDAAQALSRANKQLNDYGYGLIVWDAYRPWYLTKMLADILPAQDKGLLEDPQQGSPHNRGLSVDVSLYSLATGQDIKMISFFDELSLRAYSKFQGGSELERYQRDLLRQLMQLEGFSTIEHEWWHFDYQNFGNYQLLNIPFNQLDN